MSSIEEELPFVLAGLVGGKLTSHAEFNVIVDLTIEDHRPVEPSLFKRRHVLAVSHVGCVRNQMIGLQLVHRIAAKGDGFGLSRTICSRPCGNPVVDEIRKVGLRVVGIRRRNRFTGAVCRRDSISNQMPMLMQFRWHDDRVVGISRRGVPLACRHHASGSLSNSNSTHRRIAECIHRASRFDIRSVTLAMPSESVA